MRKLIPEFNTAYGIEKSILTIVTDGYSHRADVLYPDAEEEKQIAEQIGESDSWRVQKKRQLVDPYSGKVYAYENDRYGRSDFEKTTNLLEWLKAETGVITTGYFVCGRKADMTDLLSNIGHETAINYNTEKQKQMWLQARKEGIITGVSGGATFIPIALLFIP